MGRDRTSVAARLAAVFTGSLVVASVPVALAADSVEPRAQTSVLAAAKSLEARENAATLELYALESELGRTHSELASLTARRVAVERERAATRRHLASAEAALRVSEAQLAELARTVYEQSGRADPLAVMLGASSLENALDGLDSLSRAADEKDRIIAQTRAARTKLRELDRRLAARKAELAGLAAAAAARADQLGAATAERRRFLSALRLRQELNAARVAAIEARARAAKKRSAALSARAAPVAAPAAQPLAPLSAGATVTVLSTGYSLSGRTATGIPTTFGVVAVDPSVIPLGSRLTIPGYGTGVAADTGGAVHGNVIDLWFPTRQQALAWGRRTITITLHR